MVEVIYIMSDNRSGSTLLENIFSKSDECFSVGELAMLKGHILKNGPGDKWNYTCSCGKALSDCEFWSPIIKELYDTDKENFFTAVNMASKSKSLKFNQPFPFLYKSRLLQFATEGYNKKVAATICKLYKAVADSSGKKFIIDSSKNPIQALSLYNNREGIKVKLIYLKRDIRAIAVSKRKWKATNNKRKKSLLRLVTDVFYYRRLCDTVSNLVDPKDIVLLDYESLAKNTDGELKRLFKDLNLKPFPTPKFMELVEDHTIGGTPGRFEKKPISYDERWKSEYKEDKLAFKIGKYLNNL